MIERSRHGRQVASYHLLELGFGAGAFFAAYWLRARAAAWFPEELNALGQIVWLIPVYLALWSVVTWMWDAYRAFRSRGAVQHAMSVLVTVTVATLGLFSILTVVKEHGVNRSLIGLWAGAHFVLLVLSRLTGRALLLHYTARGYDRHFVIVGATHDEGRLVARHLSAATGGVLAVKGFATEEPAEVGSTIEGLPVLGTVQDVPEIAKREVVDEVYFLPRRLALDAYRPVILACDEMGVVVHLNLSLFAEVNARVEAREVVGQDFLTLTALPRSAAQLAIKRAMDFASALALLLLLSPLLGLVALLVKATSRGPVIFRHERVGMNGRRFTLYKFRTMVQDADKLRMELESKNELDGPAFKIKDDPRMTWVGRILRKASLDEFPQLVNVLKGDMSLVGPRPLPDHEVAKIQPWQRRRMSMRPGITCLWAVNGRSQLKFDEWMRMDLEYIDRWSLWLDLKILCRTIPVVLTGKGAY